MRLTGKTCAVRLLPLCMLVWGMRFSLNRLRGSFPGNQPNPVAPGKAPYGLKEPVCIWLKGASLYKICQNMTKKYCYYFKKEEGYKLSKHTWNIVNDIELNCYVPVRPVICPPRPFVLTGGTWCILNLKIRAFWRVLLSRSSRRGLGSKKLTVWASRCSLLQSKCTCSRDQWWYWFPEC